MSVRAHRVVEIKVEESYTSFNLWHDDKLMQFLDEESNFFSQLTDDGTGVADVAVEVLKRALEQAKKLKIDLDTVECLKKDIEWAEARSEGFIQYYCF